MRRQPIEWEKLFATHVPDKGPEYIKNITPTEILQLNNKKGKLEKQAKDPNRHFSKEHLCLANKACEKMLQVISQWNVNQSHTELSFHTGQDGS